MTKTNLTLISLLMALSQAANAQCTAKSTTTSCPQTGHCAQTAAAATDSTNNATATGKGRDKGVFICHIDEMPQFPGGEKALMKYLSNNVRYPKGAMKSGAQGRVVLQFVVDEDGRVTDVKTVRSVHPLLDAEAERVARGMPDWKPGRREGKNMSVKYTLPISFKMPTGTIVDPKAYQEWRRYLKAQRDSTGMKRPNKEKSSKKTGKQEAKQK